MQLIVQEQKREFIWAVSIEAVSFFVVYVVHHKLDFIIIQVSKGASFGTYIANVLVIFLTGSLLPEAVRIAVKNGGTFGSVTEFFHFFPCREF